MSPKQRFSEKSILEKAYEIFLSDGMQAINARAVSKALNCSTQPIFSYFSNMGSLRKALIGKVIQEFNDAMAEAQNGTVIDRCCALIKFASNQPQAYNCLLTLNGDEGVSPFQLEMPVGDEISDLPREMQNSVNDKLIKYTVGYASFVAINKIKYSEEETVKELKELYSVNCNIKLDSQ